MSTDRDTTRIVRSWLEVGVTALPDRVLDAVLDQLPATPQRRSRWPAWRFAPMNLYARIGLAAVAILTVAVIGYQLLPLHDDLGASPSPSASPAMSPIEGPPTSPPSPSGLPALGLPGARANTTTGEFGWSGLSGARTGMHNVVVDGANGTSYHMTQLVFAVEDTCFPRDDVHPPVHRTVAGLDAMYLEPYTGAAMLFMPEPAAGETTEAYALPIADRTLCVYLTWDAASTAAELEAAREVVQSIRGEPLDPGGIRIVFTLGPGWDTG